MPRLDGRNHINLTVVDLDRSTEFYQAVFEMVVVNDVTPPESGFRFRTLVHPGSFASVVLGRAEPPGDPSVPDRFDERRPGLHHLAYHVPERADLDDWVTHLDGLGVTHSGITTSKHEAGSQIWLRDPDHIWLEFYWVNRDFFVDRLRQVWRRERRRAPA
ncbi:VOC family protein [Micromonospora sp. WMMD980]|uniref:VOC family protein n=1 Tax=Micromonospora sp. WMMD980 TaxID=3016088 RepID=UPI002415AB2B|nr:VOC family protein [Micromonospora sp. WMMD980]MDG4800829.1 VOC family protein [Micromonospora sp. WMMD980]